MPWRFTVVDGADAERIFMLPDSGTAVVGSSHKFADICLNDLYVARTHCEVEIDGDRVIITATTTEKETIVNGQRIRQHVMLPGEVLRGDEVFDGASRERLGDQLDRRQRGGTRG